MTKKIWIIKDLLAVTSDFLKSKNIESPRLCAEILLSHQLETGRLKLYLDYDQPIGDKDINEYRGMVKRLLLGEPIQYITGAQEFWSLEFIVDRNVLIPRPETEILVEQTLSLCSKITDSPHILDIGTGSGAIAVSLAHELRPEGKSIWATDISDKALDIAKKNSEKHGTSGYITFLSGDLFDPLKDRGTGFDCIVSNPPYVTAGEYKDLPDKIKNFEPETALLGDEDGLVYIRKIIDRAPEYINPSGWLLLEMAPGQTGRATEMLTGTGKYDNIRTVKDYSGRNRVVMAKKRKTDVR